VAIEPFAVPHQEHEPSLGLKIRTDGKTVMYSGDSGWTEEFVRRTADVDLFLCECCYWETQVDFHINYPQFEQNRARIGARRVVLSHLGREVLEKLDRIKEECARTGWSSAFERVTRRPNVLSERGVRLAEDRATPAGVGGGQPGPGEARPVSSRSTCSAV